MTETQVKVIPVTAVLELLKTVQATVRDNDDHHPQAVRSVEELIRDDFMEAIENYAEERS